MNELQKQVSAIGCVPVIKLNNPQRDAAPLSDALCAGGVPVAEITFRAAGADDAMRIMVQRHPEMLVGAGTVKNAAGIYGMFAMLSIWIGPFLHIGAHYLLLKATGAVCGVFSGKQTTELIQDFSSAAGLLLAMTGTICLMLMISLICYMKGVG
jgi:hypothetical protein